MNKRQFLKGLIVFIPAGGVIQALARQAECEGLAPDSGAVHPATGAPAQAARPESAAAADVGTQPGGAYDPSSHWYGMGIEVEKCIGCNRCVEACKAENDVPPEPYFFRTWVERYTIKGGGETVVESISVNPKPHGDPAPEDRDVVRTFFVPKLCNQCAHPPCVQVCPVGATFQTRDGVVLVDKQRCIGCRYCIQACPYGARYLDHRTQTADKCTFCYHRIRKGLLPACVEVCPTGARIFGDLKSRASRLVRFERMNKINVLKPDLNTDPKVYYAQLDGEVR